MADDDKTPGYHRVRQPQLNGQTFFPPTGSKHNALVVTRGHAFARDPFFDMFASNPEIEWSAVEHPAAQLLFNAESARQFDCYVLYDMPGIEFRRVGDGVPRFFEPPGFYQQGLLAMLEQGTPLVILHHAAAAWPAWPLWADIVGGQFLYQPMLSRGVPKPDSGYRLEATHTITPVAAHPITQGVEPFTLTDELYLWQVFEADVEPLFRSDFTFTDEHFFSAREALAGRLHSRAGWQHAAGSNLVGWVKHYRNSPVVYLQFGDGPTAYAHPVFRRILANAIRWACSPEAAAWARKRAQRDNAHNKMNQPEQRHDG